MRRDARGVAALAGWLSVVVLGGCGDGAPVELDKTVDAEESRDEAAQETEAPADPVAGGATEDAGACVIGWTTVPKLPSDAARGRNAEGLAHHEAGRYEASLAAFRAALELEPEYDAARFNAACAAARLGRRDEAMREVRALLCRDLPTYGPKASEDADLEPLRDAIAAEATRLAAVHREAMESGVPLVAWRETPTNHGDQEAISRQWAQSVLLLPETRRVVPVGPRVESRGAGYRIVATDVDVARERVAVASYVGNAAEYPYIRPIRLRLFEAPTGRELATAPGPEDPPFFAVGIVDEGLVLQAPEASGEGLESWTLLATGERRRGGALPRRRIVAQQAAWSIAEEAEGFSVAGARLRGPDVDVALGAPHGALDRHRVQVSADGTLAVVVSARWGECGYPDRFVLDVVDLRTREVTRQLEGEGQIHVAFGRDGALYAHTRDGLRRYPSPLEERFEALPEGLGLSSMPWDFNPYC